MFTDCPACHRQFHIYAAQLSAAAGEVKCGFCGQQYNALARLYDKPPAPLQQKAPVPAADEPQFDIPGEAVEAAPAARAAVSSRATDTLAATTGAEQPEGRAAAADSFAGFDFSEELLEEPAPVPGRVSRLLWAAGVTLLLIAAVVQLLWFNRDEVMARYTDSIPWYKRLCAELDCNVARHRELSGITLLNRDVRDHPRYADALLVNATMSNQSQTLRPFPVVQLTLYDTDGTLLAYRRFQPHEYLDGSIDIDAGMQPGTPVHIVLEVLGSVAGAVSFEFEFL